MLYYKMNTQTIFMCVVALLIGMLVANMLQNVCGCKKVEGFVVVDSENNINTGANPNTDSRMSAINQFIVNNQMNGRRANRAACGGRHTDSQSMKISEAEDILKTLCSEDTLNGAGDFNTALSDMIALGTCETSIPAVDGAFADACVASGFSTVQGGGSAGVNAPPAKVDCVGAFGEWGGCSVGCGGGTHTRSFTPTTAASNGGAACPADETRHCNTQACKVDCEGVFGGWRGCSVGCGGGTQSRSFIASTIVSGGGAECPADETQPCNTQACTDLCQPDPCFDGVECSYTDNGFLCGEMGDGGVWKSCPEGYAGDGHRTKTGCVADPCADFEGDGLQAQGILGPEWGRVDKCADMTPMMCPLSVVDGTPEEEGSDKRASHLCPSTCGLCAEDANPQGSGH